MIDEKEGFDFPVPTCTDRTVTTETRYRVRKTFNGKWVCDIGSFDTFEEAVSYGKNNLGAPEEGAKYFPIREYLETETLIYEMPK